MAKKKSKKSRSRTAPIQAVPQQPQETLAVKIPRRAIDDEEFNPDYTPIVRDLKRIGTLAGAFFVVLVVLSFIL